MSRSCLVRVWRRSDPTINMVQLWTWDESKNSRNIEKHGLSLETATLVFADPIAQTVADPFEDEQRWRTFGEVRNTLILTVHTDPIYDGNELIRSGRIVSARKATAHEWHWFEDQSHD